MTGEDAATEDVLIDALKYSAFLNAFQDLLSIPPKALAEYGCLRELLRAERLIATIRGEVEKYACR